ncbi:MAG: hypothetical protein GDA56_26930 [Hormoscilla sp. GM7CHS1pb]|nr:hypothetical protein [Hormoscilla sp. GM7CHS1pb]
MEAEPLYTEALGMAGELLGSAHPDIATFVRYLRVFSQGREVMSFLGVGQND